MATAGAALEGRSIGFIGCGAMARALAGGLVSSGVDVAKVRGADPDAAQRRGFEEDLGASAIDSNAQLVGECDVIVIAVKAGVVPAVLRDIAGTPGLDGPLWISIVAGIPLATLGEGLPGGARIVRAMPNTPVLVGAAATAYSANASTGDDDRAVAEALFRAVGTCWEAPSEALLDAVTGLSGSGPAYVFLLLEALADAGVRVGLPREAAHQLACQTVHGATLLAMETGRHPASLKDQVTSPGGTTIAGLEQLEAAGFRSALYRAVAAATARSRELSRS